MGRPKIEGLASVLLRLLASDLERLDALVAEERARRADPGFTRTDLLREIVRAYLDAHGTGARKKPRAR